MKKRVGKGKAAERNRHWLKAVFVSIFSEVHFGVALLKKVGIDVFLR